MRSGRSIFFASSTANCDSVWPAPVPSYPTCKRSQIDFLGERADISPLLQAAEIVWIPSIANCGRQVALEAMAQGCTVVASDVPCLRDVIVDGETGILAPPGDVAQLSRITHRLFGDALLRERLGQAARLHAARRYSVAEAALNWRGLYRGVAA
jgi:glycosyltransferase involved in cell wall biosynthesis